MKLRHSKRYIIDIDGRWGRTSLLLMAASFFLNVVYYFGLCNFADLGFFKVFFCALLPIALSLGYLVVIYILRWNAPGIYALMGAGFCALLAIGSLFSGDIIRIILAALGYAIAAGVLLLHGADTLRNTSLCVAVFVIPAVVRVLMFDLGRIGIFTWVREGAVICLLGALCCIPLMMKHKKNA